jgi:hypothetical protein
MGQGNNFLLFRRLQSSYDVTCNEEGNMTKTTTAHRVKKHRAALRAAGLRPIQIWVPDARQRGFAKECRRQSRKLHGDPQEADILKWLAKAAATEGWK